MYTWKRTILEINQLNNSRISQALPKHVEIQITTVVDRT